MIVTFPYENGFAEQNGGNGVGALVCEKVAIKSGDKPKVAIKSGDKPNMARQL